MIKVGHGIMFVLCTVGAVVDPHPRGMALAAGLAAASLLFFINACVTESAS